MNINKVIIILQSNKDKKYQKFKDFSREYIENNLKENSLEKFIADNILV